MDVVWDGVTQPEMLTRDVLLQRYSFADAAKAGRWDDVFAALSEHPEWINCTRPGGSAWFTPLHQAAYQGVSQDVVMRLIKAGALRNLQNSRAERAVDIAEREGHKHLGSPLAPRLKHLVPHGILAKIQEHFHQLIRGRIDGALGDHQLRLPELECLLELKNPAMWFPVPGMYGGFSYTLQRDGVDAMLVVDSWSRVEGASGQRQHITNKGDIECPTTEDVTP